MAGSSGGKWVELEIDMRINDTGTNYFSNFCGKIPDRRQLSRGRILK